MWASCSEAYSASAAIPRSFGSQAAARAPAGAALDDLLGDVRATEVLEVRQSEPVAELVVGALGVDGVRHRIRQDPAGVGGVEEQDAAVLAGVLLRGSTDFALSLALGRVGDDGRT